MPAPINEWLVALIVAVGPVVVSLIDWLCATFIGKIPPWLKPILATALGFAVTYLGGLTPANPILGALLVGIAIPGLRQIVTWLGRALGVKFFK